MAGKLNSKAGTTFISNLDMLDGRNAHIAAMLDVCRCLWVLPVCWILPF
jgi:hypothetical protein